MEISLSLKRAFHIALIPCLTHTPRTSISFHFLEYLSLPLCAEHSIPPYLGAESLIEPFEIEAADDTLTVCPFIPSIS